MGYRMVLTEKIDEAKQRVADSLIFGGSSKNSSVVTIPFSKEVVEWLTKKHVKVYVARMAVDFFLSNYLTTIVAKRAEGMDGYDPVSGADVRLFSGQASTMWYRRLAAIANDRVSFLDDFMYTYLCAAVAGELRHFPNKGSSDEGPMLDRWWITDEGSSSDRSETQRRFLTNVSIKESKEFLAFATKAFLSSGWGGGYGGKPWSDIAKTGHDRAIGSVDAIGFIDRVFDLKHNNGPMFDKNSVIRQNDIGYILNAKFEIKTDDQWTKWFHWSTKPLYEVVETARSIGLWQAAKPHDNLENKLPQGIGPQEAGNYDDDDDDSVPESSPHGPPSFPAAPDACPKGTDHG